MDRPGTGHATRGWLEALALGRPELRAWVLYDWAVCGWQTVILTAIFPIYFHDVAGAELPEGSATVRFATATALSVTVVAVAAPLLGTLADRIAARKTMLALCLTAGVLATASMALIRRGDLTLATVAFVVAYIGASGSLVFYDSLLPHVARQDEVDRVSTIGHALGYLGGGILLGLELGWLALAKGFGHSLYGSDPAAPVRWVFLTVAAWWLAFAIPLFVQVREPAADRRRSERGRLANTLQRTRALMANVFYHRQAALMLIAFLVYQAGVETIQKMAAMFGKDVGLSDAGLLTTILLVQFVGIPFAILFGMLADRIGAKASILIALTAYGLASIIGFFLTTLTQFVLIALLVAMVRGGCQALSRSLFARLVPPSDASAYFGLFAVAEKIAGAVGPGIFAVVVATTGSSHHAVGALLAFFVVGGGLLSRVRVAKGVAGTSGDRW